MKAVPSSYETKCAACGDDIECGDMIVCEDGEWIHEDCAEGDNE
jgi:hypothetical protein